MNSKRVEVFFEFLIFGIIIGITEDLIAIKIATNEPITPRIIAIIVLIAVPFSIIGEIVADKVDLVKLSRKFLNKYK